MKLLEKFLAHKAYNMRVSSVLMTTQAGSGHVTSALSAADIVAVLFFYAMQFDPKNLQNQNNDRFILSKGHAAPILYAAFAELGLLTQEELLQYRSLSSVLEGHPTPRFFGADVATGSLGQGLSMGLGMSLAARVDALDFRVWALLGDAEISEGSVWEAIELATYYKVDNLTAIVDVNRLGQTGQTIEGHDLDRYARMFQAFGWHAIIVDGHNIPALMNACDEAKKVRGKPCVILAKTFKGHGVDLAEDKNGFHGKAFTKEQLPAALKSLHEHFKDDVTDPGFVSELRLPHTASIKKSSSKSNSWLMPEPTYKKGQEIATRQAYGQALVALGGVCHEVVSLDAEVKNSTFAELFEAKYPNRFFQCFVAEQNMVSMGVGFAARGKIPFASTFAAFMSRAFDQIRMAAIGQANIKLVGSHAGVSIGQDGPSQMGLEDIALMRTLPGSVILYPCDAVSSWKLVGAMAHHHGVSYLRTTRGATPVIYDNNEQFPIGSCKVLRQSHGKKNALLIIAAGITVFEALKAYDFFKERGIEVAVIDLYSIKPMARDVIIDMAHKSHNRVLTVEDHYLEGGIGQAVMYELHDKGIRVESLAVKKLPRSGKPEELMAHEHIDGAAIIKKIHEMTGAITP